MSLVIFILLLYFLLPTSVHPCPKTSFTCGNTTHDIPYPFFTDNSPGECKAFHHIQCLDLSLVVQFNQQGFLFPVRNISSSEHTIVVHDINLILSSSQFDCHLFYNFTVPIPHVNVTQLSLLANSRISSFRCSMQDDRHNFFQNLPDHAPAEDYDIFIHRSDQLHNDPPHVPPCFPPNRIRFNWQLLFDEHNNNISLLSAGYSNDWEDRLDCFSCHITVTNGNASEDPRNEQCLGNGSSANNGDKKGKHSGKGIIIGASVGGAALAAILLLCLAFVLYRRKKKRSRSPSSNLLTRSSLSDPYYSKDLEDCSFGYQTHLFSYEELEEATNRFDSSKELGSGGFGNVYKGKLRDGRTVAIKRLYENNYNRMDQFFNEVSILSRLRHPNLVLLYGCTSRQSRQHLLVYEYVPNGTVADHLHGSRAAERVLTWPVRLNIAIETAEALAYLHAVEPPIIHRDVKSNNILLDGNYHVKVGDFGLSRLFPLDVTHVSTAPQGTPGYVDPEYHKCYQLTDKSDVYSLGVVLVELISSKPAVDLGRRREEINLSTMAINKIQKCELDQLVDPELGYESDWATKKAITMVAELAFRCLQPDGDMRPPVKEVLEGLTGILKEGYYKGKDGEVGMDDDDGLLKNIPPSSPDTVTAKWVSNETTPNTSS